MVALIPILKDVSEKSSSFFKLVLTDGLTKSAKSQGLIPAFAPPPLLIMSESKPAAGPPSLLYLVLNHTSIVPSIPAAQTYFLVKVVR